MTKRALDRGVVVRRIETAMRELPERDVWKIGNDASGLANLKDAFIPTMAERYADFTMPEEASQPRTETRDLLLEIAKRANALLSPMYSMRGHANELLKDRRPTLRQIEEAIALLAKDASQAATKLDQTASEKRKGADRPKRIADQAALDFMRICGRPPSLVTEKDTRIGLRKGRSITRGVFLDFLTKVFAALNVDADPLRHAREAIPRLKRDADGPLSWC